MRATRDVVDRLQTIFDGAWKRVRGGFVPECVGEEDAPENLYPLDHAREEWVWTLWVNYPPPKGSGLVNHWSNLHSVYYKPIDTWLVPTQLAVWEAFVLLLLLLLLLFFMRLTVFIVRYGFLLSEESANTNQPLNNIVCEPNFYGNSSKPLKGLGFLAEFR